MKNEDWWSINGNHYEWISAYISRYSFYELYNRITKKALSRKSMNFLRELSEQ
jgi:hypothetical protein